MTAEEYLKKKGMSNVGHYGLLIVDTSKSKMHQIMEDYAEQQIKVLKEENVYLHNDGSKDFIIGEQKQKLEDQEKQIKELKEENTKYAKANEMIREVNKQLKTEVENLEGWRQCPECGAAV